MYERAVKTCHLAGHKAISHKKKIYAIGDTQTQTQTQTIDGYWSIVKRSIKGTYTHVYEHLQKYLEEFDFRRNHRTENIFELLVKKSRKVS